MGEMIGEVNQIPTFKTNFGNIVATEIVSEILENALDIALNKTGKNSKDIK